jgi:hypothetical protein
MMAAKESIERPTGYTVVTADYNQRLGMVQATVKGRDHEDVNPRRAD